MENAEMPKNAEFYCEVSHFICCKKSNYEIHYQTKHISIVSMEMKWKMWKCQKCRILLRSMSFYML